MADEPDQRNELDDFLVVLRKVQKADPPLAAIKKAQEAAKRIKAMSKSGSAAEAHLRILAQIEARLAEIYP
jgi:hypothetical protein